MSIIEHVVTYSLSASPADGFNPFDGVTPSWGPFEPVLKSKVGMILGVIWAACFVYAALQLTEGFGKLAKARQTGMPGALDDARSNLMFPIGSIIGLTLVPLIYALLAK